jgi:hypothetical protein
MAEVSTFAFVRHLIATGNICNELYGVSEYGAVNLRGLTSFWVL